MIRRPFMVALLALAMLAFLAGAACAYRGGTPSFTPITDMLRTTDMSAVAGEAPLSTQVVAPQADSFTLSVFAQTGQDAISGAGRFLIEDKGWYRLYMDALVGIETGNIGAGVSVDADQTGVGFVDWFLNRLPFHGIGGGAYYDLSDRDLKWIAYTVLVNF